MRIRGEYTFPLSLPWRLDGATDDVAAPLVVCLHGMGMQEDSFALLLQRLFRLPCHFLLPRAPHPVEIRSENRIGAAWYAYDGDANRFRGALEQNESLVLGLLRHVERTHGLVPRRRILFGFSQGGYCGAWVALRNPDVFAGLVVSGARVKTELLECELPRAAASRFEVLLCHGFQDSSVPHAFATRSEIALRQAGISVELASFDSGHALGRGQIEAIASWLEKRFL